MVPPPSSCNNDRWFISEACLQTASSFPALENFALKMCSALDSECSCKKETNMERLKSGPPIGMAGETLDAAYKHQRIIKFKAEFGIITENQSQ